MSKKITIQTFNHKNVNLSDLENADKSELAKIVFKLALKLQRIEAVTDISFV